MSIPLLIGLEIVVLAAIVAAVLARRRGSPTDRCRGCGYDLTAHQSAGCPECGVDLQAVAPVAAGATPPMGTIRRSFLLALILLAVALAASPLAGRLVPVASAYSTPLLLEKPQSGAYTSIGIDATVVARRAPLPRPDKVQLTLTDLDDNTHVLDVDGRVMIATYTDAAGRTTIWPVGETDNRTITAIQAWFAAAGVETADPNRLHRETDRVAGHLHDPDEHFQHLAGEGIVPQTVAGFWPGWPFGQKTESLSIATAADPWRPLLLTAPWLALWLAGTMLLVAAGARRRRRYAKLVVSRVADAVRHVLRSLLRCTSGSASMARASRV